jgi:hypothetical protein
MQHIIRLEPTAIIRRPDGINSPVSVIGPFATYYDAKRWALMANAALEAAGVKELFIELLDDPADLLDNPDA